MERMNIIGIDIVLLDEETGDYEFKLNINKAFIDIFDLDMDLLMEGVTNLLENNIVEKEEE